mmetsp:Transcript_81490/g.174582  ORF Transcript_81490/g.174582 Transcript_81490/m.174582 type:complete len:104 (+) Transcript_81490:477-788(+)
MLMPRMSVLILLSLLAPLRQLLVGPDEDGVPGLLPSLAWVSSPMPAPLAGEGQPPKCLRRPALRCPRPQLGRLATTAKGEGNGWTLNPEESATMRGYPSPGLP